MAWVDVLSASDLEVSRKRLVRVDGKQILVMQTEHGISACQNRCPHEGYPLSEGDLSDDGTLRCNWHCWTFDLVSGKTLVGGDALVRYDAKVENGRVFVALDDSDRERACARALENLPRALDDADQSRLLRETARIIVAGGDPLDAIRVALQWVAPRLRYGTTHAIAGAADWIALALSPASSADERLAALGEVLGHIADDGRRERRFPFSTERRAWDANSFLDAIECGNEALATALLRGALAEGNGFRDLVPTLAKAALSHYADFGHSVIFVIKSAELAERLGPVTDETLLCLLARHFCYATREDLLPEFQKYAVARKRWAGDPTQSREMNMASIRQASIAEALDLVTAWSRLHPPQTIFRVLVDAAAFALLHVDESTFVTTRGTIAKNTGWLDYTHAITFAEAGERIARIVPDLWPELLLQIACFIGRGNGCVDSKLDITYWETEDTSATLETLRASLFDHGRDRFIISVHLIKTLFAAVRLIESGDAEPRLIAAALRRFFRAPIKGRHVIRTARQMLEVVTAS